MKSDFDIKNQTSPIFSLIQKKIKDDYTNLSQNKIQPWFVLNTGKKLEIENFYGKKINYDGISFEGSPKLTFWDNYIDPFLEDIIIRNIQETTVFCQDQQIQNKKPLKETGELLKILVDNIYSEMDKLCKINPEKLTAKNNHMNDFIDKAINGGVKLKKPFPKKFSFTTLVSILTLLGGLYAYQYHWRPEINITNIEAQYARGTKVNDMRINFSFKISNTGKSKTKNLTLFSAFPKWVAQETGITVVPHDFTESEVKNLVENEETTFTIYKDINFDDFVQNHNMADGIWLNLVMRWKGDNLVYWGMSFEKHLLVFLRTSMKDNKMIFHAQQIEEKDFTFWFLKKNKRPNIFKTLENLEAAKLLYGDTSRFD